MPSYVFNDPSIAAAANSLGQIFSPQARAAGQQAMANINLTNAQRGAYDAQAKYDASRAMGQDQLNSGYSSIVSAFAQPANSIDGARNAVWQALGHLAARDPKATRDLVGTWAALDPTANGRMAGATVLGNNPSINDAFTPEQGAAIRSQNILGDQVKAFGTQQLQNQGNLAVAGADNDAAMLRLKATPLTEQQVRGKLIDSWAPTDQNKYMLLDLYKQQMENEGDLAVANANNAAAIPTRTQREGEWYNSLTPEQKMAIEVGPHNVPEGAGVGLPSGYPALNFSVPAPSPPGSGSRSSGSRGGAAFDPVKDALTESDLVSKVASEVDAIVGYNREKGIGKKLNPQISEEIISTAVALVRNEGVPFKEAVNKAFMAYTGGMGNLYDPRGFLGLGIGGGGPVMEIRDPNSVPLLPWQQEQARSIRQSLPTQQPPAPSPVAQAFVPQATPQAPQITPVPSDPRQLQVGQQYVLPNGQVGVYNGRGFETQ